MIKQRIVISILIIQTGCAHILWQRNARKEVSEIKEGQAINIINEIREKAGITEKIYLYSFKTSEFGYGDGISRSGRKVKIHLREEVLEFFSDDALRGMLAHEIGHYVAGHVDAKKKIS